MKVLKTFMFLTFWRQTQNFVYTRILKCTSFYVLLCHIWKLCFGLIIAISGYIWNSHFYMQACVHDRKSSGFLESVFKHSTLMCHEGTFVWQNPSQAINALLWFLAICRGKVRKLLNHQSLNQLSGRVSWLCACTHVFQCLNQSCIFPQNHWITLLQVQTNSTPVNDCQFSACFYLVLLPTLLSFSLFFCRTYLCVYVFLGS